MNLSLTLDNPTKRLALFGTADRNLRMIRDAFGVQIVSRDDTIRLSGQPNDVARAAAVLENLQKHLRRADYVTTEDVAAAASMLKSGRVKRIILARPAVEAGERLGFLPGDLQAKVNPYLRPLFDALHDMMDFDQVKRFMMNDVIEVVPLAFMRGRTLNESAIILDEAQNTTPSQMLMFLTRLGNDSKMIVTGDPSQIDLEEDQPSGLMDAVERLRGIKLIATVELKRADIVRHRLVQSIVNAYGHED